MAKVVVTDTQDWRKIAEMAGGDPTIIMHDPATNELEVTDVTQSALTAAHAAYVADQTNIDAATAQVRLDAERTTSASRADLDIGTRALVEVLLFEINKANTRLQELQDAFTAIKGTAGGSDNIRAAIPGPGTPSDPAPVNFANVNPKLRSEVLQKYVDDINSGVADP
jgi:hypothetical protein